jgi:hypothetical protein
MLKLADIIVNREGGREEGRQEENEIGREEGRPPHPRAH